MKRFRIIIPSWSPLGADMQAETGNQYPAFIQLGGLPLYAHIILLYEKIKHDAEFFIVLPEAAEDIELSRVNGFDVHVIRLADSQSIGATVLSAMQDCEPRQSIVVHMADTLLAAPELDERSTIYVQRRTDLYRWTSIRQETGGSVRILHDRDHRSAGFEQAVCVGVFVFSNAQQLKKNLSAAIESRLSGMDPFFSAIEHYSKIHPVELKVPEYWYDCGHVDSYYESRLSFHNLRHFNTLTYDSDNGLVTKRSQNVQAFRHQVRWFKQVPDELASFLPRIYDSSDGESPYITMELLSIPTLGDLLVNGRLEIGAWNDVAKKISHILESLRKYSFKAKIAEKIAYEIYIAKTRDRILQFREQRPDAADLCVLVDGKRFSLADVLSTLDEYSACASLMMLEALVPIHGDMCFSNVMYDLRGRHIKLIDPRGEFGIPGIYGDPRYDRAKLMHSYAGGYDFIVSDQFAVKVEASGVLHCSIRTGDYHDKVRQIFDAALFSTMQDRQQCEAIQALLFLSMLPLHCDKPNRQLAMLAVGLQLYARNMMEGKDA